MERSGRVAGGFRSRQKRAMISASTVSFLVRRNSRKSEELHLSRIEHTEGQPRLMQGPYQGLAINSTSFQPKVDLLELKGAGLQLGQILFNTSAAIAEVAFPKPAPVTGKQAKVESRFYYVNAHEVTFFHQTPIKE